MPKVTIVLTSYNHAAYLRESIDGVINQTFEDWELLIWDDVSSDNSWQIIQEYKDPRIKAIRNEKTRRYIYAINESIRKASNEGYIAIHHSDDAWEHEKLAEQVAYLDAHPETGAVFTHVQVVDENNNAIENDWFNYGNRSRHEWLRTYFFNANRLCHPSALVRKEAYLKAGLYKTAHAQIDDAEMWTRLLKHYDIHVVEKKLTRHRIFSNRSNVSADSPSTRNRLQFEWLVQKENYVSLDTEEILSIFPEARQWSSPRGNDSRFLLAMTAIHLGNSPGTRLFGLNQLYNLLINPADAGKISELYRFDYLDFIRLTGQEAIFQQPADERIVRIPPFLSAAMRSALSKSRSVVRRLLNQCMISTVWGK